MPTYFYKQFEVNYTINKCENPMNGYSSEANIKCNLDWSHSLQIPKFQTTDYTKKGVEQEIKRLVNRYIDFEWQEFNACP